MKFKQRRVPFAYEEISYLESTGTQYIDTGIKAIANSKVEMKFNRTAYAGQTNVSAIFGGYDSNQRNYGLAIDTSTIYWMFGGQSNAKKTFPLNTDYEVIFDATNKTFTVGDFTQSFSSLSLPAQSNGNIYLFTNSAVGSLSTYDKNYWLKGKIYYFRYYENGSLKNNFIPVLRKIDNVAGMYDTVEGKFYGNLGTGSFIAGEKILTVDTVKIDKYEFYDYLESTGTQYIDTGFIPNQDSKAELTFQHTTQSTVVAAGAIFGERGSSAVDRAFCLASASGTTTSTTFDIQFGNNTTGGDPQFDFNKHTIIIAKKGYWDGKLAYESTDTFTGAYSCWLFGRQSTANVTNPCKIFACKLWDNGVLVRNFYPAKRKSDGAIGMYDKVEKKFYANSGTGSFIAGSELPMPTQSNEVQELRLPYNGNKYRFFDYIESTGTQWINTGILPKANQELEIRFTLENITNNHAIFGGRNTTTNKTCTMFFLSGPKYFRFDKFSQQTIGNASMSRAEDIYKFELSNGVITLTNETTGVKDSKTISGIYDLNGDFPIYLFCVNTSGTSFDYPLKGSIYEWKMKENGELVQHLLPAQRLSDNAIGMYDKVTNAFYPNAGTGTFIAGNEIKPMFPFWKKYPDVPSQYEVKEYLESTSTQYIDLGKPFDSDTIEFIYSNAVSSTSGAYMFGTYPAETRYTITVNPDKEHVLAYKNSQVFRIKNGTDKCTLYVNPTTGEVDFNGEKYTITKGSLSSTTNILLFGASNVGNTPYQLSRLASLRVYSFRTWSPSGIKTRELIPVLRKSDNVLGMYDIVTDTLYTNSGTGEFTSN